MGIVALDTLNGHVNVIGIVFTVQKECLVSRYQDRSLHTIYFLFQDGHQIIIIHVLSLNIVSIIRGFFIEKFDYRHIQFLCQLGELRGRHFGPGYIQVIDLVFVQGLYIPVCLPVIFFSAVIEELYLVFFHVKHLRWIWRKYIINNANISCIYLTRETEMAELKEGFFICSGPA